MPSRRLFVAVDISEEARRRAADHIDKMRALVDGVRVGWERAEKLHVTLKFLGKVDEADVAHVSDTTASVAAGFAPFRIALAGTGVFPRLKQPRVLWLGINEERVLPKIAADLESRLSVLGFEVEERPFSPHLTIGRIREQQKAKRLAEAHLQSRFEPVEFTVTELVVYESILRPNGSVYGVVSKHPISSPDISRSPR